MADVRELPGDRPVRAALDGGDADAAVVACPPHPQYGGSRRDAKLRAVSEALQEAGLDCLRLDYGPWDGGEGEAEDVRRAIDWLRERYETVGSFGYSFGAGIALRAASTRPDQCAVSVLAPPATSAGVDVSRVLADIAAPLQVVVGERDTTVDWASARDRASEIGQRTDTIPGDHFFVGQTDEVAALVGEFLPAHCCL
jgi:alpha/beta superfamily hydrolase